MLRPVVMHLKPYIVWDITYKFFLRLKADGLIFQRIFGRSQACANQNVALYKDHINTETPLLGIEPSALYTFKDEYLKLATDKSAAKKLAKNCFLIEEF